MPRIVFIACCLLGLLAGSARLPAAEKVDYVRQVKPIFAAHCYACHGGLRQRSGLRLDTVKLMLEGGDGGPALVPGKPDESWLMEVLAGDAGLQMPPEGEGEALTAEELGLVRRWIAEGANFPNDEQPEQDPRRHWSYQSPRRPPVPTIAGQAADHPLDAFIAAHHERLGLQPAPEADRGLLLRRLYLDLIGIPPTLDQREAFLNNPSPRAYEETVEQLLANPLHAQRWGRHWMDVWRYSDWYGRRPSNEIRYSQRHIWRWRDWIVQSIGEDKGYDQMLREMLAGDELAPTDPDVLRATGYLGRNWYKFDRDVWLFDTVEQTSKALLALPMKCARCHDHKFDPISQQEYYELRAFFEPHGFRTDRVEAGTAAEVDNGQDKVLKDGLSRVYDVKPDAPTYLYLRGDSRRPDKERALQPQVPLSLGRKGLDIQTVALPPQAYLAELWPAEAERLKQQAVEQVAQAAAAVSGAEQAEARALEKLAAEKLAAAQPQPPSEGPPAAFLQERFAKADPKVWKTVSGQWEYAENKLIQRQVTSFATIVTTANHPKNFQAHLRYRTLAPAGYRSVGLSFDYVNQGQSQDVYTAISSRSNRQTVQAFHRTGGKQVYPPEGIVPTMLSVGEIVDLKVTVRQRQLTIVLNDEEKLRYALPLARQEGKFALWVHDGSAEFLELEILPLALSLEDLAEQAATATAQVKLARAEHALAVAQQHALDARLAAENARHTSGVDRPLAEQASRAERQVALRTAERDLCKTDLQPQDTPQAQAARAKVQQQVEAARVALEATSVEYTAFQPTHPTTSTGRRTALARWLTQADHPRTARVAVNHIWMRHFAEPLVTPVDDMGPRSRPPALPEVLDWLAVELVESGWSMKHLHRLIVTSQAYRRSSAAGDEASGNRDKDPNNRYLWKMNARRMEAEVVRDSLLACAEQLDASHGGAELDEAKGQASRRRSLYFRTTPDNKMEMLELFDLANPNECYRRLTSVVPQQSLALINSPLAISQSRRLARRLNETAADVPRSDTAFIEVAFAQILSRMPSESERAACLRFLKRQEGLLSKPPTAAFDGNQEVVAASDQPALRARENLIQVLFSHNDFVTIR